MIPIAQTKTVIKKQDGTIVQRGNCYAACIASILEVPITEVPNVEVFYHLDSGYHNEVMLTFLNSKGWELCGDDTFKVFHDGMYGVVEQKRQELIELNKDQYYLVSGNSPRGVRHICIYQNGRLVHDPYPTKEGLMTLEYFQSIERKK